MAEETRRRQRAYEHRLRKQDKIGRLITGRTVYHLPAYWQPTSADGTEAAECGRRGLPLPITADAIALRVLCTKCLRVVDPPTATEVKEMETTNG